MTTPAPSKRRFTVPCKITVEHTMESLEAHVALGNGVEPGLGDRVAVHGDAVTVPFGESITIEREATITRANIFEKFWLRLKSQVEVTELYEVSFSPGRIK